MALTNAAGAPAVGPLVGTSDVPDAELIARTLAGSEAAYAALVRRHYPTAFAVALAHTGERADAEDICHDAFVRAAKALEDCRERDRFGAWLCVIVRNLARNAAARARVRRAEPLEHESAASDDDPARRAELAELRGQLERALATIPPVQREIVLLHDLHGWAHEDIASMLRLTANNCRQHLFQARKRLRAALGGNTSTEYLHD